MVSGRECGRSELVSDSHHAHGMILTVFFNLKNTLICVNRHLVCIRACHMKYRCQRVTHSVVEARMRFTE